MPQYMLSLMRSGAMWSCGQPAGLNRRGTFWPSIWRWILAERTTRPISLLYRGGVFRPGMRRY
jgi:hypothetical protein